MFFGPEKIDVKYWDFFMTHSKTGPGTWIENSQKKRKGKKGSEISLKNVHCLSN